ncbi:MAG: hypothetical protein IKR25_09520, partial [Muribaculaceae bacterium]|nr:hypothetical protein [Muribaculaceae bacterium]
LFFLLCKFFVIFFVCGFFVGDFGATDFGATALPWHGGPGLLGCLLGGCDGIAAWGTAVAGTGGLLWLGLGRCCGTWGLRLACWVAGWGCGSAAAQGTWLG